MTTLEQAARLALEALVKIAEALQEERRYVRAADARRAITALRSALEQPQQEPDGLPLVIAGAIFDFAGYLTTRDKVIKVGSTANASPIADLVKEWAAVRGLSLTDAAVLSWQEWLHTAPPAPRRLTEQEVGAIMEELNAYGTRLYEFARAIEARILGEQT